MTDKNTNKAYEKAQKFFEEAKEAEKQKDYDKAKEFLSCNF